ncbi:MAG: 50S ribosomal protein L24 [Candidatus Omnitrophota bacterium]
MFRIKKNDMVIVNAGRDKGKSGKVLRVLRSDDKAIVEGVNFTKKHVRKTREDQQGGIIHREGPIHMSNLAIFCKRCAKGVKVGYSVLKDGSKSRYCKKCNELF